MPNAPKANVIVSYSHKDEEWLEKYLRPQFGALAKAGVVEYWDDRKIKQGQDWYEEIRAAFARADFAVLMVSASFLSSDFCHEEEIPYLLTQAYRGRLQLLPILLTNCPWTAFPWLSAKQMLPRDGKNVKSDFGHDPESVFAECAERVLEAVQSGEPLKPLQEVQWEMPSQVDINRLPKTSGKLFGRHQRIKELFEHWDGPETRVVSYVAWGGVGKSALIDHWVEMMAEDNYRGADTVYAWSFYSQGTSERVTSAELFIREALQFFGDPKPDEGSAWDKGDRLADMIQKRRTLLLLDGMEPLQSPHEFNRGEVQDPALKVLLERLAEKNPGLCVVTTREPVADLEGAQQYDLEKVTTGAGRALLRTSDIHGTDEELENAVRELGNHALALNLLTGYLTEWHGGRIAGLADLPPGAFPEETGRQARRVIAAWEAKLGQGPEIEVLRTLGLFDAPAERPALEAVWGGDEIQGLNERLRVGDAEAAIARLRDWKLLAAPKGDHHPDDRLDCHPLLREHFRDQLRAELPEAWKEGNGRLFEYYQSVPEKHQPDTLEELAPLYQAVAHGCAAGRHQEAMISVFLERIDRGYEAYSLHKLGAFGSHLSAVASFFEHRWSTPAVRLGARLEAFVLHAAGFCLRALGRLREAAEPLDASIDAAARREDWENAARAAGNLSELRLTSGEVEAAVEAGRRALKYADRSEDEFERLKQRAKLADAEHQAGRLEQAEALFREAERLQAESQPQYPLLYSLPGYRFCDLLLARGETAEGQHRAHQTIEIARRNKWLLDIALDHLSLGPAALALGDLAEASKNLRQAVDGLRAAGAQDFVPLGLLARAAYYRTVSDHPLAEKDLHESAKIARRGGMRLYLTDCHLEWARLHLARQERSDAQTRLAQARKLIDETGYHRRDQELADLEQQCAAL